MYILERLIWAVLPSLFCGILLARYKKIIDKHGEEVNKRADARKEESFLALEMQMANAKLSYATAMALKRGHANGEVEDGITAYEDAKKKYFDFLNRQATDHLSI